MLNKWTFFFIDFQKFFIAFISVEICLPNIHFKKWQYFYISSQSLPGDYILWRICVHCGYSRIPFETFGLRKMSLVYLNVCFENCRKIQTQKIHYLLQLINWHFHRKKREWFDLWEALEMFFDVTTHHWLIQFDGMHDKLEKIKHFSAWRNFWSKKGFS